MSRKGAKRAGEIISGPDIARSAPLFVYVFWDSGSLPDPCPSPIQRFYRLSHK